MSRLLKFLRLPLAERKMLVKAVLLLWVARLGLWILPFQTLRDLLIKKRHQSAAASGAEATMVQKITRSVRVASRCVPAATCLSQALVTVALLEGSGLSGSLRIGVARNKVGKLEAHAWVEREGKVIIGGNEADLAHFTVLQAVEGT